jgi:hypothetical protein
MEVLMNLWLAFNVVFGLWTGKNLLVRLTAFITHRKFIQAELGKFIDLFVLVSILAYYFSV